MVLSVWWTGCRFWWDVDFLQTLNLLGSFIVSSENTLPPPLHPPVFQRPPPPVQVHSSPGWEVWGRGCWYDLAVFQLSYVNSGLFEIKVFLIFLFTEYLQRFVLEFCTLFMNPLLSASYVTEVHLSKFRNLYGQIPLRYTLFDFYQFLCISLSALVATVSLVQHPLVAEF